MTTIHQTANPAPQANLPVSLRVSQVGDHAAAGATGAKTVAINAGQTTGTHAIGTVDDLAPEIPGLLKVELSTGSGYTVGKDAWAVTEVADNEKPIGPPELRIADASAVEGGDLVFVVSLSRALEINLPVMWNYGPGHNVIGHGPIEQACWNHNVGERDKAGTNKNWCEYHYQTTDHLGAVTTHPVSDYAADMGSRPEIGSDFAPTAGQKLIVFTAGQTRKEIRFTTVDDTWNEGSEQMTVSLRNPGVQGLKVVDTWAEGAINDNGNDTVTVPKITVPIGWQPPSN